eukprot:6845657-Pyramimonas_sp.AAC.2
MPSWRRAEKGLYRSVSNAITTRGFHTRIGTFTSAVYYASVERHATRCRARDNASKRICATLILNSLLDHSI